MSSRRMNSNSSMMSMSDGIEWDETFHFQVLQEQYHTVSEDIMEAEGNNEIEMEVVPPSSLLHMKRPLSVVVVSPSDSFPPPQQMSEEREVTCFISDSRFCPPSPLAQRQQDDTNQSKLIKKQKMERRVNFQSENEICESKVILEEKDCEELWWTEAERQAIINREELLSKTESNQEHAKRLADLWQRCSVSDDVWKEVHAKTSDLSGLVCQSDARGLEDDLLPAMQQHQENAVRSILKAQGRFKENSMDPQLLPSLLKEQYEELSRTAQVFARALGEGDSLEAKSLNFAGTRLFI